MAVILVIYGHVVFGQLIPRNRIIIHILVIWHSIIRQRLLVPTNGGSLYLVFFTSYLGKWKVKHEWLIESNQNIRFALGCCHLMSFNVNLMSWRSWTYPLTGAFAPELFWGNIQVYLSFQSFSRISMEQVVEILPRITHVFPHIIVWRPGDTMS